MYPNWKLKTNLCPNGSNIKIDAVKAQTLEIKRSNHAIDFKIERIKVDVTFQNTLRDTMMEDKRDREQRER